MEKLRKDNLWIGVALGLLLPATLFGVLFGVAVLVETLSGKDIWVSGIAQKTLLLSIIPNLFILRYYLLKLKYDLTGRGIMVATFVCAIIFAVLEFSLKA
ncbi:MAG: hypothetical protein LBR51_01855 [Bacteroidales bacterium]|jgi:membrane protease YdiL (CAAX protease family)|nr:hypothetical protein [Bacteroidales bacterium]